MMRTISRLLLLSAVAATAAVTAVAEPASRSGVTLVREYTEAQKTPGGKEIRRIRIEYDWDRGITTERVFDKEGALVSSRAREAAPTPTEAEIASAIAIVDQDSEVAEIRSRQAGIAIDGGFSYHTTEGACAAPARCVQIFLFDGENVVRHMMVDLRSNSIVERDYIPPQNKGAVK